MLASTLVPIPRLAPTIAAELGAVAPSRSTFGRGQDAIDSAYPGQGVTVDVPRSSVVPAAALRFELGAVAPLTPPALASPSTARPPAAGSAGRLPRAADRVALPTASAPRPRMAAGNGTMTLAAWMRRTRGGARRPGLFLHRPVLGGSTGSEVNRGNWLGSVRHAPSAPRIMRNSDFTRDGSVT
jgi:hypothetical protein